MSFNKKHDLIVYLGWLLVFSMLILGAAVMVFTPPSPTLEEKKIGFAAATFTGLLVLIIFSTILYIDQPEGPGKKIFNTLVTAITPIIGAIVGYIFAVTT